MGTEVHCILKHSYFVALMGIMVKMEENITTATEARRSLRNSARATLLDVASISFERRYFSRKMEISWVYSPILSV
jgi:hypothetical protein